MAVTDITREEAQKNLWTHLGICVSHACFLALLFVDTSPALMAVIALVILAWTLFGSLVWGAYLWRLSSLDDENRD